MIRKTGQNAPKIILPSISNDLFSTNTLKGKPYLISFFRFATCPFCNLRLNMLINRLDELKGDFTIVAIFDSPLKTLIKTSKKHEAPFPILADENKQYYKLFGVKKSFLGMLHGMILHSPTLFKGMLKGYIPFPITGSMLTMPAEFLVDKKGIIQHTFYAKHEAEHLDFEIIKSFARTQNTA